MTNFIFQASPWMLPAFMLVVLVISIELPYRLRHVLLRTTVNIDPINVLQAGLLTLSAFVLSLAFSQASARFDARRNVVVREANAIGTTWLRAKALVPQAKLFRQILTDDTADRLAFYEGRLTSVTYGQMIERASLDQGKLWNLAFPALQAHPTNAPLILLTQSLDKTIDVIAEQRQSLASHVPTAIVVLTLALVTLAALSLGIRFAIAGSRPIALSALYVAAYVIVIGMMIDYDRPNSGFVTVSLTPLTTQLASMQRQP